MQLVVQLYLACAAVCIVAASPLRAAMPGRDGLEQPPLFSSELGGVRAVPLFVVQAHLLPPAAAYMS